MISPPPPKRAPRAKSLSPEDMELWRVVARTIKPLKKKAKLRVAEPARADAAPKEASKSAPARARIKSALPAPALPAPRKPALPRIQPIEDKVKRRLARGRLQADMKIDLHGMRQHEAHDALHGFIFRARSQGARIVIVVTGKGRGSMDQDTHAQTGGVLQRMARHWLSAPDLRDSVIGFDEADQAHGGAGALYVRIRRDRAGGGEP